MGTLRTLFSISVVFAHSYGYMLVGGRNPVQIFYMISGFLISYVVVEKNAYANTKSFYINRYLRLYPIYFAVATSTLAVMIVDHFLIGNEVEFFEAYQDNPFTANALLVFSNTFLFLQDWIMFTSVIDGKLIFLTDFHKSDIPLYKGLLAPQAWTLGVELSFYVIAPFILSKKRTLLSLLSASLILRVYLIYIGIGMNDPWNYRFFPTELTLFLLGAISHQIFLPFYLNFFSEQSLEKCSALSTYFLITATLIFWLIPASEAVKALALFVVFLILMPLTFIFQSKRAWDKWIGDLSYPIYICHMLVIYILGIFSGKSGANNTIFESFIVVLFSILLSIFLNTYIGKPVESLRNRFRKNP